MNKLQELFWAASRRARSKRAALFRQIFKLDETTKILDIGSEKGININLVIAGSKVKPENVFIADIDLEAISYGRDKFGFQSVLIGESGTLPFADQGFDLVYCSSVIEHATVPKTNLWEIVSEKEFGEAAWENQKILAREIERVGRQFFVQTPARSFPIESHTWLPMYSFLPRPILLKALKFSNKYWIKQADPDFNLLDTQQMKTLFPSAEIVLEKKFGLIKSIMAVKTLR